MLLHKVDGVRGLYKQVSDIFFWAKKTHAWLVSSSEEVNGGNNAHACIFFHP